MVEAGEDEDLCWDQGKQPRTEESKNGTVILWVDANIYTQENQRNLVEFMGASNRISRFVRMKSTEAALSCFAKHIKEIDLLICSGAYSNQMIKEIISKFKVHLPYFQMVIYCYNIDAHQKKVKKYGMLRFVTNKAENICTLIRSFKRRIEKYSIVKRSGALIDEFTDPFASGKGLSHIIFIREAGSRFKLKFKKQEIKEQLLKAGYRAGKQEKYAMHAIEQNVEEIFAKSLFHVYTKECFIYRETNRRLRKYLNVLPQEIFLQENMKLVQELSFKNRVFQKLVPILPFAIELNKQIEQFNSPGWFQKEARYQYGNLWRALTLDQEKLDKFKESVGKKIGFPAFSSSSKKKERALKFPGNTMMQITFPDPPKKDCIYPIDISPFSVYDDEEEILFPAGSTFTIKSYGNDPDIHKVLISLEYFPNPKQYTKIKKLGDYETIDVTKLKHDNIINLCDTLRSSQIIKNIKGNIYNGFVIGIFQEKNGVIMVAETLTENQSLLNIDFRTII